jgi:uncharacterized protein (DUF2384 family)
MQPESVLMTLKIRKGIRRRHKIEAKDFEVIMSKNGNLSSEGLEALHRRFQEQSRKAQAYYTIMHKVRDIVGNDDAANAWMNEALARFDGKTPAELTNEGREEEVLSYISSLKR